MKTMKKLIAISLAVVMVVAVLATMVVPASAMLWHATENNTTNFIASPDKEIVINAGKLPEQYSDGTAVSIELGTGDADWQYAYPHTLNKKYTPGGYPDALDADVYIMYDSTYLYIKEVRRNAMTSGDRSTYRFLLSNKVLGTQRENAFPVGAYVTVDFNMDATADSAVNNAVSGKTTTYMWAKDNADNTRTTWYYVDDTVVINGIKSVSTLQEGAYVSETAIPWTSIGDCTTAPEVGTLIGFKHRPKVGSADSYAQIYLLENEQPSGKTHQAGEKTYHNDWDYFCPMYLRDVDAKAAEQVIDTSWYDYSATSLDIYTAGQLRGLSYISLQYDKFDDPKENGGKYVCRDILKNKTINIKADIDLNPNWTVGDTTPPLYVWYDIACLSGTFDGNGHTISGVYMDDVWCANALKGADGNFFFTIRRYGDSTKSGGEGAAGNGASKTRDRGFFCSAYGVTDMCAVRNVVFMNSVLESKQNNVGGIIGVVESGHRITIENVYSDIDINAYIDSNHNHSYVGGIIGKLGGAGAGTTFNNIVVAGNLILTTDGVATGTGVSGIIADGSASEAITISDTLVCSEVVSYPANVADNHRAVSKMSSSRSEPNHVTYHPADGSTTGTSGKVVNGVRVYNAVSYPTDWVNIDEGNANVKMPPKVAAMIDSSLWVQEKIDGEKMSIRVLSGLNAIENSWDKFGVKVEILTANGYVMVNDDAGKLVSDKVYTSIEAAGATVEASELGTTYIGGVVLSNAPKSITLRITPVKYSGDAAYYGASAVVSYVDGVLQ